MPGVGSAGLIRITAGIGPAGGSRLATVHLGLLLSEKSRLLGGRGLKLFPSALAVRAGVGLNFWPQYSAEVRACQ